MPGAAAPGEAMVVMAEVGAPHGVRGAVRLAVFAEDPLGLRRYNPFSGPDGRTFKLKSVKASGKAVVAEIEGVSDRDAAVALRGTRLSVPRKRLPRPEPDEFYHVDLVGLEARLANGEVLGTVRAVHDHGAGDVLDIHGAREVVIPFTRAAVPEVNLADGFLVIDPPPGLLDDDAPA